MCQLKYYPRRLPFSLANKGNLCYFTWAMNETISKIRQHAKQQLKTIILPESGDPRIIEACRIIEEQGIARILLMSEDKMDAGLQEQYAQEFFQLRKHKGISIEGARKVISSPLYYSAMMVRNNAADGFVAGAHHTTSNIARAAIYSLGIDSCLKVVCSCFIMIMPDRSWGEDGVLIFADCGIVPRPESRQLACIAILAARLAKDVLSMEPRVALLSYSTKGSAGQKEAVKKVTQATELVRQMEPSLLVDGELQADAALVADVAKRKHADSILGGKANILIFPDLNSGNISYKLVQRLAQAEAIGPILLGLNRPCSDLSRGCSVEDIVNCVAVTAIRAQV